MTLHSLSKRPLLGPLSERGHLLRNGPTGEGVADNGPGEQASRERQQQGE